MSRSPPGVVLVGVVAPCAAPSAWANTAPACTGSSSATTQLDTPVGTTVSCSDSDAGTRLRYTVTVPPTHGAVSPGWSCGTFVYTPASGWTGTDSFTVVADDGELSSAASVPANAPAAAIGRLGHRAGPRLAERAESVAGLLSGPRLRGR